MNATGLVPSEIVIREAPVTVQLRFALPPAEMVGVSAENETIVGGSTTVHVEYLAVGKLGANRPVAVQTYKFDFLAAAHSAVVPDSRVKKSGKTVPAFTAPVSVLTHC
jgi:hypothetical protein